MCAHAGGCPYTYNTFGMPTRDFTLTPPRGTHPTVTYRAGRHDAFTHKGVGGASLGARAPVRRHRAVTRWAVSLSVSSAKRLFGFEDERGARHRVPGAAFGGERIGDVIPSVPAVATHFAQYHVPWPERGSSARELLHAIAREQQKRARLRSSCGP